MFEQAFSNGCLAGLLGGLAVVGIAAIGVTLLAVFSDKNGTPTPDQVAGEAFEKALQHPDLLGLT